MRKLVLALGGGFPSLSDREQMEILAQVGWDGFFSGFDPVRGNFHIAKKAKELGLLYQSVHAEFVRCNKMWEEGVEGDFELSGQLRCLRHCADIGVDLVVMHAFIGFHDFSPNQIGIDRYGKLYEEAKKLGITVAMENTEGQVYLDALLNAFKDDKTVGFCIDTGHEMCYNESKDLISLYGDKLVATHLNDNMGITGDEITWKDDAHLFPFDGIADWEGIARRLNNVGYTGPLTFELTTISKPGHNTHDRYKDLDYKGYASLVLEKAKRVRDLVEKN